MEYRGSGGHLLRWSILQRFKSFPFPSCFTIGFSPFHAIAPSPMPTIPVIRFNRATCSLAPFPFACHNFFILSVCSSFSAPKPRFIFIPLLLYIIKLLFYLHVFKLACYALKIHRLSSLLSAVLCLAFLVGPRPLQLQHILRPLFHSLGIKALHPTLS